ncbi:MAG: SCP2 sterol-binding domain-containing protein [Acidimicrobiales bacterium]
MPAVVAFLSDGWIEAMDRAAGADPGLRRATSDLAMVVEQEVTGVEGLAGVDGESATFHVCFDHGTVSVRSGPASDATVRFSQDLATAVEIVQGTGSGQRAFMSGRLRVGGDLTALLANALVLAELDDVFAGVRAETELPDLGPGASHA